MKYAFVILALALAAYSQGPLGGGGRSSGSVVTTPASVTQNLNSLGTCNTTKSADYNVSTTHTVTLSGNCSISFVQPPAGKSVLVRLAVTQAASGGPFTVSLPGAKWPGGVAPVMSAGAGSIDWFACMLDGTASFCTAAQEFQ